MADKYSYRCAKVNAAGPKSDNYFFRKSEIAERRKIARMTRDEL
jgi:hypothetical protein